MKSLKRHLLPCGAIFATLFLNGCAGMIHYENESSGASNSELGPTFYPPPAIGDFLCLAVPVGTPIYGNFNKQPIGYTPDVVAFSGRQQGNEIMILANNGQTEWIDGRVIQPYGTAHPGHTCFIYRPDGTDLQYVIH